MADLIKLAREQIAAFTSKDWSRYRTLFTDDAVYDEEATRRRITGPDAIVKAVKPWTDAFPDVRCSEVSAQASGDTVVLELVWEGTNRGPLFGPLASIPPSGKSGKVQAVQVLRFRGDKISEVRHYFDLMTILEQIGAMPGAQAPAP